MKRLALLIPMLVFAVTAHAADAEQTPATSLFFNADETKAISDLVAKSTPDEDDNGDIRLGAVLYYGPDNWTLWLKNRRWTPDSDSPDLHVIAVEPGRVHLTWMGDGNEVPREITLAPYQTFHVATGKIGEGLR